jgi:hypothetical protein
MTNTTQNLYICSGWDQKDWSLHSLEIEAQLENLDREAGREYVPMDVYLDPQTIKKHFQDSAIRARWAKIHLATP